jgi:hypothetical protein
MDRHTCYESNSYRVSSQYLERIQVGTRCTDHRCNPADTRTTRPDPVAGIRRSFRTDEHHKVAVRRHSVRLEEKH